MEIVIGFLLSTGFLATAGSVVAFMYGVLWLSVVSQGDRPRIEALLRADKAGALYVRTVTAMLERFDRALLPDNAEDTPIPHPGRGWWRNFDWLMEPRAPTRASATAAASEPHGWPLFGLSLRLALAYPIILLVAFWAATGEAGRIGTLEVLPADPPFWAQGATICALVLLGVGLTLEIMLPNRRGLRLVFVLAGLAVAGAFAFAVAVSAGVSWATRTGHGLLGYSVFTCTLLAMAMAGAAIASRADPVLTTWLVFLAVLPLVNAVFDFVSVALTRYLVRLGARQGWLAWGIGFGDLIAAGFLFTLLGFALIAVTHAMNAVSGEPLLDLQSLFDDLHDPGEWSGYWWLYLTIFSTLVPTFAHLSLSAFSMVAWIPRGLKVRVLRLIAGAETSPIDRACSAGVLTAMAAFAIAVPVVATVMIGAALYDFCNDIGDLYLLVFETFARRIGASVESAWI